jgi:hypothetical protein
VRTTVTYQKLKIRLSMEEISTAGVVSAEVDPLTADGVPPPPPPSPPPPAASSLSHGQPVSQAEQYQPQDVTYPYYPQEGVQAQYIQVTQSEPSTIHMPRSTF